jgi:thiamine-phosphate pyrophosphorylase
VILHALVDDLETAHAAAEGGATVIQLRLKRLSTAELVEQARPFRDLCAGYDAAFVVNDDVEAAIEVGAEGVHLGREDEGIERAHDAGLLLGISARSFDEALAAEFEQPDYIGAGPVWETPTKPDAGPPLGLEGLRVICSAVEVPVIAIGGIDEGNAVACLEAGAAGVAVVRAAADAASLRAVLDRAAV